MRITEEEKDALHEEMLTGFIKNANSLDGMVLVGIRNNSERTNIEVRCGANIKNVYRAASAMLEALLEGDPSGTQIDDKDEAKMVAVLADMLLMLAGDDPENLQKLKLGEFLSEFSKKN